MEADRELIVAALRAVADGRQEYGLSARSGDVFIAAAEHDGEAYALRLAADLIENGSVEAVRQFLSWAPSWKWPEYEKKLGLAVLG